MKNKHQILYFCVVTLSIPVILHGQPGRETVTEGNQLFSEEKFDAAHNKYQDALLQDPASPLIQFNIGNVLYKKKNYEKVTEAYNRALDTDDPLLQSKVYYNIGNTLYRQNKLPESILAYEQALKLNPDDQDAKYNLEFVRNKLKENAQPQPQDQQQQQQQKDKQEEQEKKEEEQHQSQQEPEKRKEMTKEEAEQLLEALKENQEDLKKKQAQAQGDIRVAKDW
jgi:Ca-activated chloride channel family protein